MDVLQGGCIWGEGIEVVRMYGHYRSHVKSNGQEVGKQPELESFLV